MIKSFTVIDNNTGKQADQAGIALNEEWAGKLMYCDMEGFAILEDGSLILADECGRFEYCPEGRFSVVEKNTMPKYLDADNRIRILKTVILGVEKPDGSFISFPLEDDVNTVSLSDETKNMCKVCERITDANKDIFWVFARTHQPEDKEEFCRVPARFCPACGRMIGGDEFRIPNLGQWILKEVEERANHHEKRIWRET